MSALLWTVAAVIALSVGGLSLLAWLDHRRYTDDRRDDMPRLASVCAGCGIRTGIRPGHYPPGWCAYYCPACDVGVPVCCKGCASTYARRHRNLHHHHHRQETR